MARVRAKTDVYLGEHGYRTAGEEFEYTGPANHNLEPAKASETYQGWDRDALKAELNTRGIAFSANAGEKTLRGLLLADDEG